MNNEFTKRLLNVIPGGAHTYSRGYDQYPENAPAILKRGKGAYVFDEKENCFLDYGMALRSVNIGYAEESIAQAAIEQINFGNNLTRPSLIELQAAELFVDTIKTVDMVKFTKNGSSAVTAAVKLARAYTGRELIARCAEHPFFSYDDWFIGSTIVNRGVPIETINNTKMFSYNDIESLQALIKEYPGKIACVVMEPVTTVEPENNFLLNVQKICHENGIVFILDEMITGFRWHLKGAHHLYGLSPDLCTFGKAMANGFSVGCIAGKRELMQLGSIEFPGNERVFLLSTTHGAEMSSLGAFVATIEFIKKHNVINHLWEYGKKLIEMINSVAKEYNLQNHIIAGGIPCSPYYRTLDQEQKDSLSFKTLLMQEMIKHGVLWTGGIALCYRHDEKALALTEEALRKAMEIYSKALKEGCDKYLVGDSIKPVFRKFN